MANKKKEVYRPGPMTEGKRNIIQGLLQEYDIQSAADIQEALKDRMLHRHGYTAADVSVLDQLAIVGSSGMGALTYRPAWDLSRDTSPGNLDELASQCAALLQHEESTDPTRCFSWAEAAAAHGLR